MYQILVSVFGRPNENTVLPILDHLTGQGRNQLLSRGGGGDSHQSKVGVYIRHTITTGVRGVSPPPPPGKKFIFGKNIVHFQ